MPTFRPSRPLSGLAAAGLSAVLLAVLATSSHAQGVSNAQQGAGNAANAISEAVQEGSSPYRPTPATTPDDERRARCQSLRDEYNAASKQRTYNSSGTAGQTAQGRSIPKIERDKTLKSLKETYEANCT